MAESKIEIKVGNVEFSGSGSQKWVSEQLEKMLTRIPELVELGGAEITKVSKVQKAPKKRGRKPGRKPAAKTTAAKTTTAKAASTAKATPAKRGPKPKAKVTSAKKAAAPKAAPAKRGRKPKAAVAATKTVAKKTATKTTAKKAAPKKAAPKKAAPKKAAPKVAAAATATGPTVSSARLSTFLKKHKAVENQTKRFLGAAAYMQKNGFATLTTRQVSAALKAAKMEKLSNASQMLNNNVNRGYCLKEGKQFTVTAKGLTEFK